MATKTFYSQSFTGTPCANNAYCSGRTPSAQTNHARVTSELASDLQATTWPLSSEENLRVSRFLECNPGVVSWAAGTYAITIDITVANMNLTLNEIHLCRVTSSCGAVSTIGSLTGIGRSMGSTGSITHNVTGSADTNGSTDKLLVMFVMTNGAMSFQAVTVQSTAATPIETAAAAFGGDDEFYAFPRPSDDSGIISVFA